MMATIKTGDGFTGTLNYALDLNKRNNKEVRFLAVEGVDLRFTYGKKGTSNYNIRSMSRDFRLQAKLNPKVSKPVKHISLSWPPEDLPRLTDQEMMSAAREYMKRMGYVNTQFIAVRHLEKDNPHLHLVINAVNNDGRKISDSNERIRSGRICKDITIERNYTFGIHKSVSRAEDITSEKERARYKISQETVKALCYVDDIRALPAQLRKTGVQCILKEDGEGKVCGITFSTKVDGTKYILAGSKVDRSLSAGNIQWTIRRRNELDETVRQADQMMEFYDRIRPYYTIPSHVHKKCRQLRDNLKEMRKEESRLKQREKEGLSLATKAIVISLMYGNTIMALTLGLVTFLYTGYREGTIEATQDAQRNAREELAAIKEQYYYNNPFSQQKEEEQQVRRGGGFRR